MTVVIVDDDDSVTVVIVDDDADDADDGDDGGADDDDDDDYDDYDDYGCDGGDDDDEDDEHDDDADLILHTRKQSDIVGSDRLVPSSCSLFHTPNSIDGGFMSKGKKNIKTQPRMPGKIRVRL